MTVKHYFSILLILAILTSCNENTKEDSIYEPLLDSLYVGLIELYEDYNEVASPTTSLVFVTKTIYPCVNYSVVHETLQYGNNIIVDIKGIYIENICLTALGPAIGRSFVGLKNGEYQLMIRYNSVTDRYTITVTDSLLIMVDEQRSFTANPQPPWTRYPENSFVYLCGTTNETEWIYEDFLDTLTSNLNIEEFTISENAYMGYPHQPAGHYVDHPSRFFHYENESILLAAEELLKKYAVNIISQYQGVGIQIISWDNRRYYSWMYY